jgi:hypothetical protein
MVISLSRSVMSNWDLLGVAIFVFLVMWAWWGHALWRRHWGQKFWF